MADCSLVRLYQTLHRMFHPTSRHIENGGEKTIRYIYIYTNNKVYIYIYIYIYILFWRGSISRGFNFAISIGKYEKKGMEFRDSSILNFVLFPNSFSLLKFLDEVEHAKRFFKNSLHLDSVLPTWKNYCYLTTEDTKWKLLAKRVLTRQIYKSLK